MWTWFTGLDSRHSCKPGQLTLYSRQVLRVLWSLLMIGDVLMVCQTFPQLLRLHREGQVFLPDYKWGNEDIP